MLIGAGKTKNQPQGLPREVQMYTAVKGETRKQEQAALDTRDWQVDAYDQACAQLLDVESERQLNRLCKFGNEIQRPEEFDTRFVWFAADLWLRPVQLRHLRACESDRYERTGRQKQKSEVRHTHRNGKLRRGAIEVGQELRMKRQFGRRVAVGRDEDSVTLERGVIVIGDRDLLGHRQKVDNLR